MEVADREICGGCGYPEAEWSHRPGGWELVRCPVCGRVEGWAAGPDGTLQEVARGGEGAWAAGFPGAILRGAGRAPLERLEGALWVGETRLEAGVWRARILRGAPPAGQEGLGLPPGGWRATPPSP